MNQKDIINWVTAYATPLAPKTPSALFKEQEVKASGISYDGLSTRLSAAYSKGLIDRMHFSQAAKLLGYGEGAREGKERWAYFPKVTPPEEPAPQEPEPVVEEPVAQEPAVGETKWTDPPRDLGALLGQYVAQAIINAVAGEVGMIVGAMKNEIRRQLETQAFEVLGGSRKVRVQKPKVLVVGLLPSQAGMIQTEFGEEFDLSFVETNDNLQQLRGSVQNKDRVLLMAGKSSHSNTEVIKSSGTPLTTVRGGMSSLRAELTRLYIELDQGETE